jgi:hypothetical protein
MKKLIICGLLTLISFNAVAGLPTCRGKDDSDGRVFTDKNMKKVSGDFDSGGWVFQATKSYKVNGKNAFEGTLSFSRDGRDEKGIFFIDPSEWNCK